MTEQLAIDAVEAFVPAKNEAKPLTRNQQLAFDYARERDGVTADEVGAWIHAHRDKRPHSVDLRCDYCARDGRSVLTSKALAPLLTYRRAPGGHLYILRDPANRTHAELGEQVSDHINGDPFAGL